MIKINTKELIEILSYTPSEQNIMLVGNHGIGKSAIIKNFYEKNQKIPVISFFLGQMSDPGDLIGLMQKNEKTQSSEFLPPYWWPKDNKAIVLFLDELNRARPEILQSIMDLTLNRKLAGKSLPNNSIVISAINYGDQYQITDLDPALVSRFNIYEFYPTVEEWIIWATDVELDKRVINFIQKYPSFLDNSFSEAKRQDNFFDSSLEKSPDRRAWEKVSKLIKKVENIDEIYIKIIAGIVGVSASINFKKSIEEKSIIDIEKLLFKFSNDLLKGLKLQDFIFINEQIAHFINSGKYEKNKNDLLLENLTKYIKYLKKIKFNEAIAHFSSQLENPNFEKVLSLIFANSDELINEISKYINGIDL